MTTAEIQQAQSLLPRLVEQAEAGEEVILSRDGKPVARLIPYEARPKGRVGGQWRGQVWMAPDFDELPDDIAEAFGMREE